MCRTKIVVPDEPIPKEYYWNEPRPEGMWDFQVPAGAQKFLTTKIEKIGTEIEVLFFTDSKFSFGAYFSENPDDENFKEMELVYMEIFHCPANPKIPNGDKIICKKSGFYKVRFGNEYAWYFPLTVTVKASYTTPDGTVKILQKEDFVWDSPESPDSPPESEEES